MTLLIMLAVGVIVGRLWAYVKAGSRLTDCPKCAIEEAEQLARFELNALRNEAEARMAQAAGTETRNGSAPRHAAPKTVERT